MVRRDCVRQAHLGSPGWRFDRTLASIRSSMVRLPRSAHPATPRRHRSTADDGRLVVSAQIDLFPVKPIVEVLDPRTVVGPNTAVEQIVRVRLRPTDAPHLVFHDRHGWYCETHGPLCAAVALARS